MTPLSSATAADMAAPASTAQVQQMVTDAYDAVIGRNPTATELATSVGQVMAGTPVAALRAYLATTGYFSLAVNAIYMDIAGRAPTASETSAIQASLAGSGSLAGLRAYFTTTSEAASKISAVYVAVLGRPATASEIAYDANYLANGGSLANLRLYEAIGVGGASALQALYMDVAGRAATQTELASAQAAIAAGSTSIGGLRAYFATTAEAAGKLSALYQNELERAITPAELAADEKAIAGGSSLAAIRGYLSTSNEALGKLSALYQNELARAITPGELAADEKAIAGGSSVADIRGYLSTTAEAISSITHRLYFSAPDSAGPPGTPAGPPGTASLADDVASAERSLAGGASLAAAVASVPGVVEAITAVYQALLGVAPDTVDLSAVQQLIIGNLNQPNDYSYGRNLDISNTTLAVARESPAFTASLSQAYQAAVGRAPTPVELASDKSELGPTFPAQAIRIQVGELAGGSPPSSFGDYGNITAETIAGTASFAYGLLHNDVLISANSHLSVAINSQPSIEFGLKSPGIATAYNSGSGAFNPASDIIQIQRQQAAGFGALTLTPFGVVAGSTPFTEISFGAGLRINVFSDGVPLTAANFRFI